MKTCKRAVVFLTGVLLILAIRCMNSLNHAGGASGTDVSACIITGSVIDSTGRSVPGSIVRLRPEDYIAGRENEDTVFKRDGATDADGGYLFDSVPAGRYIIECIGPDSSGYAIACMVDTGDSVHRLSPARLQKLAIIKGHDIGNTSQDQEETRIRVRGFERSAPIDSMGNFELQVPAGWCRLHLPERSPDQPETDTLVYCNPGDNPPFYRQPRQEPSKCDDLECEIQTLLHIIDSNDLSVAPESVIMIENQRVVEIHLDGLGLRELPESIQRFSRLRVLNFGNNEIREFPRGIDRLRNLRELRAAGNRLFMVPASLGMIDSLRILDLSNNQLISLPEPLVYLSLDSLNVRENMLCNIGEPTRQWIAAFDPEWQFTQICR